MSRPGTVITVSFVPIGRSGDYAIDPERVTARPGDLLVVEGFNGLTMGQAASAPRPAERTGAIRRVVRAASERDRRIQREAEAREPEAVRRMLRLIRHERLPWKVIRAVANGLAEQMTLFFAAPQRQDARPAATALGRALGLRVILRQVGMREVTAVAGGVGRCGRELCCASWLKEFPKTTVRMAKDQNVALVAEKTAGVCGKTLCCLAYEHDFYSERRKFLPKLGKRARTTDELEGKVVGLDVLRQTFTLLDERGRRHVLSAEQWAGNDGREVPEPAVGRRTNATDPQPLIGLGGRSRRRDN